jgi:putative hemolysin
MKSYHLFMAIIFCLMSFFIFGCANTPSSSTVASDNPASLKCAVDGGFDKPLYGPDGKQYALCLFTDGTVCEQKAFYEGKCQKGQCARTCQYIGSRNEGWYDCNGKLLFWDKCQNETAATAGSC